MSLLIITREPLPGDEKLDPRWVLKTIRWAVAVECYGDYQLLDTCVSLVEAREAELKRLQCPRTVKSPWIVYERRADDDAI